MKKIISVLMIVSVLDVYADPILPPETFSEYLEACQTALDFEELPSGNCKAVNFTEMAEEGQRLFDTIGYMKITSDVDATVICRGVSRSTISSIEMLVHNRSNGNTCFFDNKIKLGLDFVSPTAPDADAFWHDPEGLVSGEVGPCATCHIAGPYIASYSAAPILAKYGLLNNLHDTFVDDSVSQPKYNIVGKTFESMNVEVQEYIQNYAENNKYPSPSCASACHVIGSNEEYDVFSIFGGGQGTVNNILSRGLMPPGRISDFNWMNNDVPEGAGDFETFSRLKTYFPQMKQCEIPEYMEARVVGSDAIMRSNSIPDDLYRFNADGLICLNQGQGFRGCEDYSVKFLCDDPGSSTGPQVWTNWQNTPPNILGDYEIRPTSCLNPTAIRAKVTYWDWRGYNTIEFDGSPDELDQFDNMGLICRSDSQSGGRTCQNYTVRFVCPIETPNIRSVWTGNGITRSYQNNNWNDAIPKGQPLTSNWTTQKWKIVPVEGTNYVRIRSVSDTNLYLAAWTVYNSPKVGLGPHSTTSLGQQWEVLRVAGSPWIRIKNRLYNNYLTMNDDSDWSDINLADLNRDWHSQLWIIE